MPYKKIDSLWLSSGRRTPQHSSCLPSKRSHRVPGCCPGAAPVLASDRRRRGLCPAWCLPPAGCPPHSSWSAQWAWPCGRKSRGSHTCKGRRSKGRARQQEQHLSRKVRGWGAAGLCFWWIAAHQSCAYSRAVSSGLSLPMRSPDAQDVSLRHAIVCELGHEALHHIIQAWAQPAARHNCR